jgi:type III secretory pathway component EscT
MLLGAGIGTAASMLYDGAYAGGHIVDDYIGIKVNVPTAGIVAPSGFGRLWSEAFIAGFFLLGGYAVAVSAFARTFATLPPGALLTARDVQTFAYVLPESIVRAAFFVASPAVAMAFITQFSLACASRVIARLSIFPLSFTLVFIGVLLVTLVTIIPITQASSDPSRMLWENLPFHG